MRVVYRACRRIYGKERVQDECLKVFKIVFPEYYKAKEGSENYVCLSDAGLERLARLFDEWKPDGKLKELCEYALTTAAKLQPTEHFSQFCEDVMSVRMRIRKLTPRECFRLMGVSDKDIDTIQNSGVSNSAQYKLAGNSIVLDVLFNLFRTMYIDTEAPKGYGTQLSLF